MDAFNNSTAVTVFYDDGNGDTGTDNTLATQFHASYTGARRRPSRSTPSASIWNIRSLKVRTTRSTSATIWTEPSPTAQMAYIFQQYGESDLSDNPDQAAAVQIALWDLSLDNHDPTSFAGHGRGRRLRQRRPQRLQRQSGHNADAAHIAGLTHQYLIAANNVTAAGAWLDATPAGTAVNRGQSLMLPSPSWDFGDRTAVTAALTATPNPSVDGQTVALRPVDRGWTARRRGYSNGFSRLRPRRSRHPTDQAGRMRCGFRGRGSP